MYLCLNLSYAHHLTKKETVDTDTWNIRNDQTRMRWTSLSNTKYLVGITVKPATYTIVSWPNLKRSPEYSSFRLIVDNREKYSYRIDYSLCHPASFYCWLGKITI